MALLPDLDVDMLDTGRRASERKRTCIQAFVTNLDDTFELKCTIRDVSNSGCKIVSSQIFELPDHVLVFPEGFGKPIRAKIVWCNKKAAGLSFDEGCQDDATVDVSHKHGQPCDELTNEDIMDLKQKKKPLGYADRLRRIRTTR